MTRRIEYSDELPDIDVRIIIDADPIKRGGHFYKCQTNFIVGLTGDLQELLDQEVISEDQLITQIQVFLQSDLRFSVGDSKNIERIRKINSLLDRVLEYLNRF